MNLNLQRSRKNHSRGAALLLVISTMIVLTILIAGLWEVAQFSWDDSGRDRYLFQARQLAESGAAIAMHPEIDRGDPALIQDYGDGRAFAVTITSEGGRILVNSVGDEVISETLLDLFVLWGLDATQAATAVDSMIDWIDADSDSRTNGAEQDHYSGLDHPEFPMNEDFVSLEQLLLVRGFDVVARRQPNWREYFTLYGDGLIDVNAAPPDLLEAFFQITTDSALAIVGTRMGNDGLMGTSDDYLIEDQNEAQVLMGLSDQDWSRVEAWATLENTTRRIDSVGSVGNVSFRLTVLSTGEDGDVVARIEE